ncbi:MAG: hypothetical protein ACW967_06795 [Candidatus Hodarchaeales archaeon]|jgi:hypothetical protein
MLNIHVYGFLKKKFDPNAQMAEHTIITVEHFPNETFMELTKRLNLTDNELGDCFVNAKIAETQTVIPDESRIALFGAGMFLACGGSHLKGHGYITNKNSIKDYYN